jgi:tetratricopeptide (TPR) repeat protein
MPLSERSAIPLLAYSAWAIDFGPYFDDVQRGFEHFKQLPVGDLRLCDLALFQTADALLKFHLEDYEGAQTLLEQVKHDADRGNCTEMMTVSRYYLGRVLWKRVKYREALEYISDAKRRDLEANNQARAAAIELVEAWLLFETGEIEQSKSVLSNARARLENLTKPIAGANRTDHLIELGNILSFQGRLHREAGEYDKALDLFAEAISVYAKHDPGHRNVARAHFNAGFVYRLLARSCSYRKPKKAELPQICEQLEQLRFKAFTELKIAQEIYELDPKRNARGLGKIHNVRALLFFDSGQYTKAEEEARKAFGYGQSKNDKMVMADARIIQSTLVLDGSKGFYDAQLALELAKEAIDYAEDTGNRRLLARAIIRKGLALLEPPNVDRLAAHRCWEEAQDRLIREDRDYLRDSLAVLEQALRKYKQMDQTIMRVSAANIRGRSLTEIHEEVDEKVIQFVYQSCGDNIQKTARTLQMHPRKVTAAISVYKISDIVLSNLNLASFPAEAKRKIETLRNKEVTGRASFLALVKKVLGSHYSFPLKSEILKHTYPRRFPTQFGARGLS